MARKPFLLRIEEELLKEFTAWAAQELRSVNGQMEYVLKEAVQKRKGNRGAPDAPQAGGNP